MIFYGQKYVQIKKKKILLLIRLVAAANTTMYFIISTSKFIRTPSLGDPNKVLKHGYISPDVKYGKVGG